MGVGVRGKLISQYYQKILGEPGVRILVFSYWLLVYWLLGRMNVEQAAGRIEN